MKQLLTLILASSFALAMNAQPAPDWSRLNAANHPRLLMDDAELQALKSDIAKEDNPALNTLHGLVMHLADSVAAVEAPVLYQKDASNKRILSRSREALTRIFTCAYAYRYSGDEKYLRHAEKDLVDVCSFPDWNPTHFLDAGEMSAATGLGFDWLYNELEESTRQLIAEKIDAYAFKPATDENLSWFYHDGGNWNQVCNSGLTVAALSVFERLDTAAARVINDAILSNKPSMVKIYSPDGNYAEGPDYWCYGTIYQTLMIDALESALGTDFGLSETEGFDRTAEYLLFTRTTTSKLFNYYDNPSHLIPAYPIWYFADKFDAPELLFNELKMLEEKRYTKTDCIRLLPMFVDHAAKIGRKHPGALSSAKIPAPAHMYHGGGTTPVVMVRADWSGTESDAYLGFKGGTPNASHTHLDGGSFVYEAAGVRWSSDLDRQKYETLENQLKSMGGDLWDVSQNSLRWKIFRMNNKQHSTLTINGHDHNAKGMARLIDCFDDERGRGGRIELSELLSQDMESAVRTIILTKDNGLRITDELSANTSGRAEIRWTMVTEAAPEMTPEGILLRSGGKRMILSTSGCPTKPVYTIWNSDPMAYDSPIAVYDAPNPGVWIVGFTTVLAAGESASLITSLDLMAD